MVAQAQCAPRAAAGRLRRAVERARRVGAFRRHRCARRRLLRRGARPDRRPDRPQRRRQDHALQLPVASLRARRGRHPVRGPLDPRPAAPRHPAARHRPHLPERGAVRPHVACSTTSRSAATAAPRRASSPTPCACRDRSPRSGASPSAPRSWSRSWTSPPSRRGPAGGLPFPVRKRVELARALAGNPKLLAARRAGRRPQPRRGRRAARPDPARARHPARHRAAGRAPHEPRHVGLRPGGRHRLRPQDRRRARRPRCSATPM